MRSIAFVCIFAVLLPATGVAKIVYTTDLEGHFGRWLELTNTSAAFRRAGDGSLSLSDGWDFVFGGDVIDRYPGELALLADLVPFLEAHPGRAHALLGNRDLNKMSLATLVAPSLFAVTRLKHALNAANARNLFENHRRQLVEAGRAADDRAVLHSLVGLLKPGGDLRRYLNVGRVAHVADGTLFVHGAWRNADPQTPLAAQVAAYNSWKQRQFEDWTKRRGAGGDKLSGRSGDSNFVFYAHYSDADWNPTWPPEDDIAYLRAAGVRRLVVGHRAYGQTPAILRRPDFEVVFADTSGCAECGVAIVEIDGAETRVRSRLRDGTLNDVRFTRGDGGPLGRWTRDGWLIVGRTPAGDWIGFKNPGNRNVVIPAADLRADGDAYVVAPRAAALIPADDFAATLALADDRARVAAYEAWTGAQLSPAQHLALIARAAESTNSFELGQFIRLAGESRDPAWTATLEGWRAAWAPIPRGWQTYLRAAAERALREIECEDRFTR